MSGTPSVSRMSDNEYALSVLGYPKVFAVKKLPFDIVPQLIHCSDDCSEGSSVVVIEKPFDIFGEE